MSRDDKVITIAELVRNSNIPRTLVPVWNKLRLECFDVAKQVYNDREIGYNVDHPPYEEMIYGPVSIASEAFKRIRRLTGLLSPMRTEPLREIDINHLIDAHVDLINYLSWSYGLIILATGYEGHINSDDVPLYFQQGLELPECGFCIIDGSTGKLVVDSKCPKHGDNA